MATAAGEEQAWEPLLAIGAAPHDDRLVHRAYEPGTPARVVPLPSDIDTRVASALIAQGPARNSVSARGWGKSRPVASNATPAGREQNRRVEIVVSGPALGAMAGWERSYSVMPR